MFELPVAAFEVAQVTRKSPGAAFALASRTYAPGHVPQIYHACVDLSSEVAYSAFEGADAGVEII